MDNKRKRKSEKGFKVMYLMINALRTKEYTIMFQTAELLKKCDTPLTEIKRKRMNTLDQELEIPNENEVNLQR